MFGPAYLRAPTQERPWQIAEVRGSIKGLLRAEQLNTSGAAKSYSGLAFMTKAAALRKRALLPS
jgi:hypothetical protein